MNKLNFNIPVMIFIVGAVLFLIAPFGLFKTFSSNDIYLAALLIESIGVTASVVVFYRDKITAVLLDEI